MTVGLAVGLARGPGAYKCLDFDARISTSDPPLCSHFNWSVNTSVESPCIDVCAAQNSLFNVQRSTSQPVYLSQRLRLTLSRDARVFRWQDRSRAFPCRFLCFPSTLCSSAVR